MVPLPLRLLLTSWEGTLTAWPHVYVHVPFCGRRCSYCDFSIAVRRSVPVSEYIDAVVAEMATRGIARQEAPLRSLYLGGGTPSKLGPDGIARLIHEIGERLGVEKFSTNPDELELTLEVNPEDVSPAAARAWAAAGVNRVSLGVQSFEPKALEWMHRQHSADDVVAAVRSIKEAGIAELSLDLIFAIPEMLGRSWTNDLNRVLELDPDHLSLYGLTVEAATPLGKWVARQTVSEAPEERYEEEFLEANRRLTDAGFQHYEVSNYARPGRRARHNSAYWSGAAYLGLGPSAHGFDGTERRWNIGPYAEWAAAANERRDPVAGSETVTGDSSIAEEVYLGLRTSGGLGIRENETLTVTSWVNAGWAVLEPSQAEARLRLTPAGWLRLDSLAATLTSLRSRS